VAVVEVLYQEEEPAGPIILPVVMEEPVDQFSQTAQEVTLQAV
jgi:hypothetical protein